MDAVNVVWARLPGPPGLAHALLRTEVARVCALPLRQVRLASLCAVCGSNGHGKPCVVPLRATRLPHVNLSRAGDLVMVAVTHCGPVGVDIECAGAPSFAGFDDVVLHPCERAGTVRDRATTWARKESLLKATGDGLSVDQREIRLSEPGRPPRLVEWVARPWLPGLAWMYDVDVDPDHVASVTVLSEQRPGINVREAVPEGLPPEARTGTGSPGTDGCASPRSR